MISRLKVRFLHGSPLKSGGVTPPDSFSGGEAAFDDAPSPHAAGRAIVGLHAGRAGRLPARPRDGPGGAVTRRAPVTPSTAFLVIGAVVGVLFMAVTPPFGGADEPAHWYRAYQVSEGSIRADRQGDRVGGFLPTSLRLSPHDRPWRGAPVPLRAEERAFVDFRNTALYAPVPYLPHAIAIAAGRVAGLPPVALFYLARVAGLAAALALAFLAIRITPLGKRTFLLLALTPMAVRQMSLMTVDSVTNGASLLFVALCLRRALASGRSPGTGATGVLALSSLVLSLSKIAYVPLSLLSLLPAAEGDGDRRALAGRARCGRARRCGGRRLAVADRRPLRGAAYRPRRRPGPADGVHPCGSHPVRPRLVGRPHAQRGDVPVAGAGIRGNAVPGHRLAASGGPDRGGAPRRARRRGPRSPGRGLIVAVAAATYALVTTTNYLAWNPVGAATVSFVQGRYYIPIAPLPLLLLTNRRLASLVPAPRLTAVAASAALLFAGVAVRNLFQRWYG